MSDEMAQLDLVYEDGSGETTEPVERWYADWLLAAYATGFHRDGKRVLRARLVFAAGGSA